MRRYNDIEIETSVYVKGLRLDILAVVNEVVLKSVECYDTYGTEFIDWDLSSCKIGEVYVALKDSYTQPESKAEQSLKSLLLQDVGFIEALREKTGLY